MFFLLDYEPFSKLFFGQVFEHFEKVYPQERKPLTEPYSAHFAWSSEEREDARFSDLGRSFFWGHFSTDFSASLLRDSACFEAVVPDDLPRKEKRVCAVVGEYFFDCSPEQSFFGY